MTPPHPPAPAALVHATYRTSSRSSATGSCVMVGAAGGWVGIQDSKQHPQRTTLATPRQHWTMFLHAIKDDQLHP
ncbi:MAG: DUF397 domain-containing protein [Pseudonocardiaceae bacterium]